MPRRNLPKFNSGCERKLTSGPRSPARKKSGGWKTPSSSVHDTSGCSGTWHGTRNSGRSNIENVSMKFFTPQLWFAINKKSRSPKSDRQWAKNSIAYYSELAKLRPRLMKSAGHFFSKAAFMLGHSYDSQPEITAVKTDHLSKTERGSG